MIEVKGVTKKYGKFTAVDNISFTVKDGEIVGFLGPNGAGKSTTMNMITGFIEQTEGEIIIDGYDMLKKPKKAKKETGFIEPNEGTIEVNGYDVQKKSAKAKRQIGYMPEGVPLYTDLTPREFVTYMAELKEIKHKEKKEKVEKVLEETGLLEVANKLIRNLSRGYKQRVSLAGALIGDPEVIVLDE